MHSAVTPFPTELCYAPYMESPEIYAYFDYRVYLADWFEYKKAENPRYSHRMFVRKTGQKSPSFLSDVIKGRRNLTPDAAVAFCRVLKLTRNRKRFFQLLVDFQQAENDADKQIFWEEISAFKRTSEARKLEGEAFEILSNWEHAAIHQMARFRDFRTDPGWIGKNLFPQVSSKVARKAVETLFAAGLLVRDTKGKLTSVDGDLATAPRLFGLAVRNYHRGMLELARNAIENCKPDRYHFQGITVAIPKDRVPELKEKIQEFTSDINAFCETSDKSPEEVIQINLHFFPLSQGRRKY